ncbi:MAG TPA: hypothetical protein VHB73_02495 [Alphaproteobacteria bacterium]|nr:hypothetical protein [Alphaproteobacteria bacterium]
MKKAALIATLGALLLAAPAYAYVNVPMVSGGIGEGGRSAIEDLQKDFTLKAVFTGEGGIYLSEVNVRILDRAGNVVAENITQGPMLLAGLPAGRYTLEASVGNYSKRESFSIGRSGLKTLFVRFPVQDENGGNYESYGTY